MLISLRHVIRIDVTPPLPRTVFALRLTAQSYAGHDVETWVVSAPGLDNAPQSVDGYGNVVRLITPPMDLDEIEIEVCGTVNRVDNVGVVKDLMEPCRSQVYLRQTRLTKAVGSIAALIDDISASSPLAVMHAWNEAIHLRWTFVDRAAEGADSEVDDEDGDGSVPDRGGDLHAHGDDDQSAMGAETEISHRAEPMAVVAQADSGDAVDLAHVFVSGARHLNLPARVIHGYIVCDFAGANGENDEAETRGAPLTSGRHTWAEVFIQGLGWVGFDPVLNQCPTDRYIRLTCGLDAEDAGMLRSAPGLDQLGQVTETIVLELVDDDEAEEDDGA
ncbi:MAG: transglutaminase family protein, partial [Pseudomonadota bacterium]